MNISRYFTKNIILESERLVLRKISTHDIDDMFEYSHNPETSKYLLWSPHKSRDETAGTIKYILSGYSNGTFHDFAVVLKSSGKMIGTAGFTSVDDKNACAEIGYVINPSFHGNGYATEAVELILNFAFCELGFNRVEAKYLPENEPSRRVMERCGMTYEGILRGKMHIKGNFRNIGICSLLSDEYFAKPHKNIYAEQNKPSFFSKLFHR